MKNKNEKVNDYMNKYSDHHCTLIKNTEICFIMFGCLKRTGRNSKFMLARHCISA